MINKINVLINEIINEILKYKFKNEKLMRLQSR